MSDYNYLPLPKRMRNESEEIDNDVSSSGRTSSNDERVDSVPKMVFNPVSKFYNSYEPEQSMTSMGQSDFTADEDLQSLKEFYVIDESNEGDGKDEDSNSSEQAYELRPEEIQKMLDEGLGTTRSMEKPFILGKELRVEEKVVNKFEVLPLDWVMVFHNSGMPIYMQRNERICTLSRPYFLGKKNLRKHHIPISAIPCLSYRKALEEEKKQAELEKRIAELFQSGEWANQRDQNITNQHKQSEDTADSTDNIVDFVEPKSSLNDGPHEIQIDNAVANDEVKVEVTDNESALKDVRFSCPFFNDDDFSRMPVVLPGGKVMPPSRVETVTTSWKNQHLNPEELNDYCKKLFLFKNVDVMHFKHWSDRREYEKTQKTQQYPTLPEGTKLISIPENTLPNSTGKPAKRDLLVNMKGSNYLSVFHEYVRRVIGHQPVYKFREIRNAATPYQATVLIDGMECGVGVGSSKRQAKAEAARASIRILIPEIKHELETNQQPDNQNKSELDLNFLDYVSVEDPRIQDFSVATGEPLPNAILRTCLARNFGTGDQNVLTEVRKLPCQNVQMTMTVGKHSATVVAKNKKEAKQRASQAILQALHPHIRSWGSLLRLYGSRSVQNYKTKEDKEVTHLQDKRKQNQPNHAVLEKVRSEMKKLKERDEAVPPICTLPVPDNLPTESGSMLNNIDLN